MSNISDFEALVRRLGPDAEFSVRSYMNHENRPALEISVNGLKHEFVFVADTLVRVPKPLPQVARAAGFDAFVSTGGRR